MPLCRIVTSVKEAEIPDGIYEDLTNLLSQKLDWETKNIVVHLIPGSRLSRGGKLSEAQAYVDLYNTNGYGSIGKRRELSAAILELLIKQLNIDQDSIFLFFNTPNPSNVGYHSKLTSDFR